MDEILNPFLSLNIIKFVYNIEVNIYITIIIIVINEINYFYKNKKLFIYTSLSK